MVKHRSSWKSHSRRSLQPLHQGPQYRIARFEPLETRDMLAVVFPDLAAVNVPAGAPVSIVLGASDSGGAAITYTATPSISNPAAQPVLTDRNNPDLLMNVHWTDPTDGTVKHGTMEFVLFEDLVPDAAKQIETLAGQGFYDNLTFHRIIAGFMMQGGDPNGDGTGGSGVKFDDQFNPNLDFTTSGILALANSGPDTNSSQFFITDAPYRSGDFRYTIIGMLTAGDDVRQAIQGVNTTVNSSSGEKSVPESPVVIDSVSVVHDHQQALIINSPSDAAGQAFDINVKADNGQGSSVTRTLHVNVQADSDANANAQPYITSISPLNAVQGGPAVSFNIPATDPDGGAIRYDAVVRPVNSQIAINVNNNTGAVTLTPDSSVVGVQGVLVGVKAASGSTATFDTQAVPLFIRPAAPTEVTLLTNPGATSWVTDRTNTNGRTLQFRLSGVVPGAEVTVFADGVAIGTATASSTSTGTVDVTTDGVTPLSYATHSITVKQTLRNQPVNIGNWNQGPVDLASDSFQAQSLTVDPNAVAFESNPVAIAGVGQLYSYQPVTNHNPSEVTIALVSGPAGMQFDASTGSVLWVPDASQLGTAHVVLTATNNAFPQFVGQQEYDIQVKTPPTLDPIPDQQIHQGRQLTFTAHGTGETALSYTLDSGAPAGAQIDSSTGVFTWTPSSSQGEATYTATVRATDLNGLSSTVTAQIAVVPNRAPTLTPVADQTIVVNKPLALTVSATDPDLPDDSLTFGLGSGAPEGAAIDPASGRFTWTPSQAQAGVFSIPITVHDQLGASVAEQFTVTATGPLKLAPVADQAVVLGSQLVVQVTAADPFVSGNLTFQLDSNAPAGAHITAVNATTAQVTWTPTQGGSFSIGVIVSDPQGATDAQTIHVSVDSAPVFAGDHPQSLTVFPGGVLQATFRASDPQSLNKIQYSLEPGTPSGMQIGATSGVLTWSVPLDFAAGNVGVSVRATEIKSDGSAGLSSLAPLSIQVSQVTPVIPIVTPVQTPIVGPGSSLSPVLGSTTVRVLGSTTTTGTSFVGASTFIADQAVVVPGAITGPAPAAVSHVLGDSGLFGTMLSPVYLSGGVPATENPQTDEPQVEKKKSAESQPVEQPQRVAEEENRLDGGTLDLIASITAVQSTRPELNDAALEALEEMAD